MKNWLLATLLVAAMAAPSLRAHEGMDDDDAKESKKQPVTLKGEILDMACYMNEEANGKEHTDCAAKCVKGGSPVGFLSEDGKAYFLVNDHKKEKAFEAAKKLAGERVVLQANLLEKGGMKALQVEGVEKASEGKTEGKVEGKSMKVAAKKWVCPMGDYESDKPGKCPKCGMDLVEKED